MVEIQGDLNMLTLVDVCSSAGFVDNEALTWQRGWPGRSKGRLQPGRLLSRLQTSFTAPISAWFLSCALL